ncbi:MAG: polysaccharide biosynthesis tyrosine autokinase [Puniceicoccaceae bacterium]|nr:polysaccharide biosynthesis tyrosine autokinase [Puniceicoccaceae bacterium]
MKNDYVRGGPDPNVGGRYGYGSGNYGYFGGNYGPYGSYGSNSSGYSSISHRSISDYILMLRERVWYLVVAFFIIFSGSILYTFNKTKVYTAYVSVQLLRDDPSAMRDESEMEPNQILSAEDLNTQISVLESLSIIQAVERRLQDEERARFMAPYVDAFSLAGPLTPVEMLAKNRRVIPRRMSLMVNIGFTHPDPIIAARVANLFADEFIAYNLTKSVDASMDAVEDLRIRADQQRQRVEELELKLAEYREEHNAVSLDQQENIANEQLMTLNAIKSGNKNLFDAQETQWNLIESYRRDDRDLWELSFIADQSRVAFMLQEVSKTKIEISSLGKRYRAKHPVMIQLLQRLQESEIELSEAVTNSTDKIYASYIEAKRNFEVSSQRLAEKENELIQLSKTRVDYNTLFREFEVQQGFLTAIVSRMTMQKAQINLKNPNARIVDQALPPLRHSSPNVFLNLVFGAFGGLASGLGLVFAIAFLDDRVKSAFDIEGTIGLPLIGVIPQIKKLDSTTKAQAVASNVDRHVTETFRSIHSAIRLNEESKDAKVFLTTSTVPSEGKSFVSSNLSLTFANNGDKTLLFDGDLRLPNIAKSLQVSNDTGLIDYIEQDLDINSVIVNEVYPNLDVLPAGGKSKNPTQVLNSEKYSSLLRSLREKYDRIVIDSPPLAAVSDALNILPHVDGVIYVIKFNTVKRKTAVINVRRLWESSTPVFGSVLNNVSAALSSYYYSHYSDRSYQDYYIDNDDDFEDQLVDNIDINDEITPEVSRES